MPAPAESRQGGESLTAEEQAVRAFVLDHADDPKSVEFDRWGPNADAELLRRFRENHSPDMSPEWLLTGVPIPEDRRIVRCRFRSRNAHGHLRLQDDLYFLDKDGKVIHGAPGNGGDRWLEPYEENLKK